MRLQKRIVLIVTTAAVLIALIASVAQRVYAHCDTLDGPVVADARRSIDEKKVDRVLKWVRSDDEALIRAAFERTLKVRAAGEAARELADQFFFETLVRIHRAGEGEAFTGLKPAGAEVEPGIAMADEALEKGSDEALVSALTQAVSEGVRSRFHEARERREHADDSIEAGRAYVAAYVDFVHFVAALDQATHGESAHAAHVGEGADHHEH